MKKVAIQQFDREYLKRCKESSAESKFEWLFAALEFVRAKKKIRHGKS